MKPLEQGRYGDRGGGEVLIEQFFLLSQSIAGCTSNHAITSRPGPAGIPMTIYERSEYGAGCTSNRAAN